MKKNEKKYYSVEYNDYGYIEIFENYNLFYNNFKITEGYDCNGSIALEKYKPLSDDIEELTSIPIIIEYDTHTKKYYDIITGEEYVRTKRDSYAQYLVNKGGHLEVYITRYYNRLSVNEVADTLRRLTPLEIEAYKFAMDNLKKAADERIQNINNSANYIEAFKRNRKK